MHIVANATLLKQVVAEDNGLQNNENLELLGPVPAVTRKKRVNSAINSTFKPMKDDIYTNY